MFFNIYEIKDCELSNYLKIGGCALGDALRLQVEFLNYLYMLFNY